MWRLGRRSVTLAPVSKSRTRALANVARLFVAAERHGQTTVDLGELRIALAEVDISALARARPSVVAGRTGSIDFSEMSLRTRIQA